MALSCLTKILNLRGKKFVSITILSTSGSLKVEITWMILELSFWEVTIWELLAYWDSVIKGLLPGSRSPITKTSDIRVVLLSWCNFNWGLLLFCHK